MSKTIFNKKLPKKCEYCKFSKSLPFGDELLCSKRGVTKKFDVCHKYKYDILKRKPKQNIISNDFQQKDFEI